MIVLNRIKPRFSGQQVLASGISNQVVTFDISFPDTNYSVITGLTNELDLESSIYPMVVRVKTKDSFTVYFSDCMDSDNYILEWSAVVL